MCVDPGCFCITTTVTDDCTGAVERIVKANMEGDVRRLHVSWSRTSSNEEILPALVLVMRWVTCLHMRGRFCAFIWVEFLECDCIFATCGVTCF